MMENWKDLFSPQILDRGLDYYDAGAVVQIKAVKDGFHAVVEGSEDYRVKIKMEDGIIRDMWCSCPYAEDGSYCKHMAAVLYEIEEEYGEDAGNYSAGLVQGSSCAAEQDLSEVIQNIPENEIRSFLLELAYEDEALQNRILTQFTEKPGGQQMMRLKKEISNITREHSDRYGFIDWREAGSYIYAMEEFLENHVPALIEKECFMKAFELTTAVFVEAGSQEMDDSDGESSELADACYEYWQEILDGCGEADEKNMFAWFEKNQNSGIVIDYMEDYIRDFLMSEFHSEDLLRQKLAMLDEQIKQAKNESGGSNTWGIRHGCGSDVLKRLEIMEKLSFPEEEIEKYKKENWEFSAIRNQQLTEYLEDGKLQEAIGLLRENKELDKDSPGMVENYSIQLIELYQKSGMEQEYKDELIFQVFNCRQWKLEFVEKLKAACSQEEWELYREKILDKSDREAIRYPLLVKEGLYERLMDEISERGYISEINQYEPVLKEKFPEKIRDMYIQYVKDQENHAFDRKSYRELAQYLKKIKEYPGGDVEAGKIAGDWRVRYRRRPAMMDELGKAGF